MTTNTVTVLCYGGPHHGKWIGVPSHPSHFMVNGMHGESDIVSKLPSYRYIKDEVNVKSDGVWLMVNLAVCESHHNRVSPELLAQFTLGHAIARLAIRPPTITDQYDTEYKP